MKANNIVAILVVLGIYIGIANAAPIEEWKKTYGGTGADNFHSVNQTSDGGYIAVGTTYTTSTQIYLVKTDSLGNRQWSKIFGGPYNDGAYSVQQTKDGGYILTGYTRNPYNNDNGWIIKTDSLGNIVWSSEYGGPNNDGFSSIQQTIDGGYIVVGSINSGFRGNDGWLLKLDVVGNQQWNKTFGGIYDDKIFSVRQTRDGGYILVGGIGELGDWEYYNTLIIKTDSYGNEKWRKILIYYEFETWANSVRQTSDGGYIIAGELRQLGPTHTWGWYAKIDSYGNEKWRKSANEVKSIEQTKDGGYILAGVTDWDDNDPDNGWVIKTDTYGNRQWEKIFGGTNIDGLNSIQQTKDGGYITAGFTKSYGTGSSDGWLIKLRENTVGITVMTPNGGENWIRGSTKTIIWNSAGTIGSYVKIELLKSGILNRVITSSTYNDGSYGWTIPSIQTLGTDYKIKIASTNNPIYTDISNNNFAISGETGIIVISPNGGESWQHGTTKMITWSKSGSPGPYIKIDLYKAGVFKQTIVSSTLNDGSHYWYIPTTQTLGSDYKIKITSTSNSAYYDWSNNYFKIY